MKHTHALLLTSVVVANFGMISAAPSTPEKPAKPAKEAPEYWDANTWDAGAKDFWHSTDNKAPEKASSTASKAAKPSVKQTSETKSASSRKDSPSPKKES